MTPANAMNNGGRGLRPVVAIDPMAGGFAAAMEALGAQMVQLPQDGFRLGPFSFRPPGTESLGRLLLLGRPSRGAATGGAR